MLLLSLSLQKNGNLAYKLCIYNISMSEAHSMKIGEKTICQLCFYKKKVSNYKGVPKFELNEHQGKLKVHCRVIKRHGASESLWKY